MGRSGLAEHPYRTTLGLYSQAAYESQLDTWRRAIKDEIANHRPHTLLLSMTDMWGWCDNTDDLTQFLENISIYGDHIRAIVHLAPPQETLIRRYMWQVVMGRTTGLSQEAGLLKGTGNWFKAAHKNRQAWLKANGGYCRVQCAHPSIDHMPMLSLWRDVLGRSQITAHALPDDIDPDTLIAEICNSFDIKPRLGRIAADALPQARPIPGRVWFSYALQTNHALAEIETRLALGPLPPRLRRQVMQRIGVPPNTAPPLSVADFAPLVKYIDPGDLPFTQTQGETYPVLEADGAFDTNALLDGFEREVQGYHSRL